MIAFPLQGSAAARPRRAHIFEREGCGHYVEPHWCSSRLVAVEDFGAPGVRKHLDSLLPEPLNVVRERERVERERAHAALMRIARRRQP
jgi:hypothetical protein